MDVGGSMDPHAELVSRLFTAASRAGRFAKFRSYYFHNCVYDAVYEDAEFRKPVPVAELLSRQRSRREARDRRRRADASRRAARSRRLDVPLRAATARPGIEWLRRLAAHFRSAVWLNPEPDRFWPGTTIEVIASVFPMWPLTLDGLAAAVRYLVRGGERPASVTRRSGTGSADRGCARERQPGGQGLPTSRAWARPCRRCRCPPRDGAGARFALTVAWSTRPFVAPVCGPRTAAVASCRAGARLPCAANPSAAAAHAGGSTAAEPSRSVTAGSGLRRIDRDHRRRTPRRSPSSSGGDVGSRGVGSCRAACR